MTVNSNAASADIRSRRAAAGLTQEELARRAQCSTSMVRLLESGYLPSSGKTMMRVTGVLCDALSTSNGAGTSDAVAKVHMGGPGAGSA